MKGSSLLRAFEPVPPTFEEQQLAAYYLWERRGRRHGHDKEDWHDAGRQLAREADGDRLAAVLGIGIIVLLVGTLVLLAADPRGPSKDDPPFAG